MLEIPSEEKWNLAYLINLACSQGKFQNLETNLGKFWFEKEQDEELQSVLNSIFERLISNTRKYLQGFYTLLDQHHFHYDSVVSFVMKILPLVGANHIQLFDFFNNVNLLHFYWKKDLFEREFRPDYQQPLDENDLVSYHLIDTTFIRSFVESSSKLIDDREKEILRFLDHVKRTNRINEGLNHCGRIFFNLFVRHHIATFSSFLEPKVFEDTSGAFMVKICFVNERFSDFLALFPLFDKIILAELSHDGFKSMILTAILCVTPNQTRIGWNKETRQFYELDLSEITEEDLIDIESYRPTIYSLVDSWSPVVDFLPPTKEKYLELVGLEIN